MFDGVMDVGADYCSHDCGRPSWGRVVFKLVVLYLMLATACWVECRFRGQGIELDASAEIVGAGPKNSRLVRFRFQDPTTGLPRMNTVSVPEHLAPQAQTVRIEYIPGQYPTSRLKSSAVPWMPSLFFWVNVVFFTAVAGVIGFVAWEANHPIPGNRIRFKKDSNAPRRVGTGGQGLRSA